MTNAVHALAQAVFRTTERARSEAAALPPTRRDAVVAAQDRIDLEALLTLIDAERAARAIAREEVN